MTFIRNSIIDSIKYSNVADLLKLVETLSNRLEAYDKDALDEVQQEVDDLKELILMYDDVVGPLNILHD
jgi:hypothetical protein